MDPFDEGRIVRTSGAVKKRMWFLAQASLLVLLTSWALVSPADVANSSITWYHNTKYSDPCYPGGCLQFTANTTASQSVYFLGVRLQVYDGNTATGKLVFDNYRACNFCSSAGGETWSLGHGRPRDDYSSISRHRCEQSGTSGHTCVQIEGTDHGKQCLWVDGSLTAHCHTYGPL